MIRLFALCVCLLAGTETVAGFQAESDRILIPKGEFHSLLPEVEGEAIGVDSFYLDKYPVTNQQFLKFVEKNKQWRKSLMPDIYGSRDYLRHWKDDLKPGPSTSSKSDRPITRISWFAANAYCSAKGGRLPTLAEWEYSAQAMEFESITEEEQFGQMLIGWYSSVDVSNQGPVGSTGIVNKYGVADQHGLVMEWVEDFKPPLGTDLSFDCGTAGRLQKDGSTGSYAKVIRYLTRMSFSAKSTTGIIGFRCAYDLSSKNNFEENPS